MKSPSPMVGRTYAKVLLDETPSDSYSTYLEMLKGISEAFHNPDFSEAMGNPVIPTQAKEEVLCAMIDTFKISADKPFRNWIHSVTQKKRIAILPRIWIVYENLLYDRKMKIKALMVTAFPFPEDGKRFLHKEMERIWKKPVDIEYRLDPSIIGGLKMFTEDQVLDISMIGQLNEIQDLLISEKR